MSTPSSSSLAKVFSPAGFAAALRNLRPGKAPGPDHFFPKLLLHAGSTVKTWLCKFFSSCVRQLKIPKTWRLYLLTIPQPNKPLEDAKNCPKTVSSAFHLNREAKRQLMMSLNRKPLPFSDTPKYLGVTSD